jgi:hypothetical protein
MADCCRGSLRICQGVTMAPLVPFVIIPLLTAMPGMAQAAADGIGTIFAGVPPAHDAAHPCLVGLLAQRCGAYGWSRRRKRRVRTYRLTKARQPRAHTRHQTGCLLHTQPGTGLRAMAVAGPGITVATIREFISAGTNL